MIDYEKIKFAIELSKEIHDVGVGFYFGGDIIPECFRIFYKDDGCFQDFESIDALITKLMEHTKTSQKYKVGDKVWFVSASGEIANTYVYFFDQLRTPTPYYINDERWFSESEIHSSRKELIDSQIKYWTELGTCNHSNYKYHAQCDGTRTDLFKTCMDCGIDLKL